jgi:flagella basal body P-ring formation protein FlgA
MRKLALLLTLLAGTHAQAAALRSMTTLHSANVYLRDLFDDAGANADKLLGPGPDPGGRIIIEAAQLNAIARQFNVAWRSVSRADRAVLEWPGRPLRREEAVEALRLAITAAGTADDIDIDLSGFTPPVVPVEGTPTSTASQLDYDGTTGRFTAMLTVTAEGMNPMDVRVSGHADAMVEAPVALARLLPETVLRADDIHIARVRTAIAQTDIATTYDQIVGMQLRRPVLAGQPLRLADLVKPPLVQRGSTVQIELSSDGLAVTGQAIALDAGAEGERVRVQNTTSHAFLFAEVIGPGQVRVTPDAPPALPTAPVRYDRRINPR